MKDYGIVAILLNNVIAIVEEVDRGVERLALGLSGPTAGIIILDNLSLVYEVTDNHLKLGAARKLNDDPAWLTG